MINSFPFIFRTSDQQFAKKNHLNLARTTKEKAPPPPTTTPKKYIQEWHHVECRDINPAPGDPNGNGSQEEPKVSGNPGGTSGSGTQGTSGTGNTGTPTENGNLQDKEPHGFEEQQEEGSDQKKPEDTGVGPNCNKSKPHKRPTFLSA